MRLVLVLMVAACGSGGSGAAIDAPSPDGSDPGGGPEGIPPRICGVSPNPCPDCLYCGLADSFCFGAQPQFTLGTGKCTSSAVTGTLTMTAGADAFTADSVAAAVVEDGAIVEGHLGTQVIALFMPATPGSYDCANTQLVMQLEYIDAAGAQYVNRPVQNRPACTIDVTSVGAVGQRIEGSFSATVQGTTTLVLSNGSFSVERVAYP